MTDCMTNHPFMYRLYSPCGAKRKDEESIGQDFVFKKGWFGWLRLLPPSLFLQLGRVGYICSIAIYSIFCMHDRNCMTNSPLMYTLYSNCNVVSLAVIREYWIIYSGPGFLAVVWFGSSPCTPSTIPLPFVSSTGDKKGRLRKRYILLTREKREGLGEETNQQTARKPGPLYII